MQEATIHERRVRMRFNGFAVSGGLAVPLRPSAVVVLAGGVGSRRLRARIRTMLFDAGLATLLIDTPATAEADHGHVGLRLDARVVAEPVIAGVDWLIQGESEAVPRDVSPLPVGCCGASTAAAGALIAAAARRPRIDPGYLDPGTRERVAGLVRAWFVTHLRAARLPSTYEVSSA
jgi:hypothetical protein